jgi:hypothetical protein
MKATTSRSKKAKARAWKAFSIWIRCSAKGYTGKDEADAVIQCYTCDKWYSVKTMSVGHGIGGRNNAVLFDERIVKPQCVGCNIWGRGQYQVFTRKLIAELGLDVYDEIVKHSSDVVKYKVADYLEIEQKYLNKLSDLKGESEI